MKEKAGWISTCLGVAVSWSLPNPYDYGALPLIILGGFLLFFGSDRVSEK